MNIEQGLSLNFQPQTMAEVEQVLQRGDLHGCLVSFILTCIQEGNTEDTITGHKLKISQFVKFALKFKVTLPTQVTPNLVKLFLIYKQEHCSGTTANNHYRELHRFFAYLADENIISESPMIKIHPPKKEQHIVKPFSVDQIKCILDICDSSFLGIRNRALILVLIDSGLRLAEVTNIKLSDVNIQSNVIRVMGKGEKERVVPIGKKAKLALFSYQKVRNSNLPDLWLTEERTPLSKRGVEITVIRLCKYAGIQGVRGSPHTFRHFFATNSMINGAPDWAVQQIMGHTTLTMTEKYRKTVNSWSAVKFHQGNDRQKGFSPADNL
jgi:integrase/recombinase XerC